MVQYKAVTLYWNLNVNMKTKIELIMKLLDQNIRLQPNNGTI